MIVDIYKLGEDFKFVKYDTWNNGKFSGPLSALELKEDEVKKRFNTSYYRTAGDEKKSEPKDKTTEKIEINIKEL